MTSLKIILFSFCYFLGQIILLMKIDLLLLENLRIAFRAIRTSLLRTILSVLIIAFGIMALVGILTNIDAIQSSLTNQFSLMGAGTDQ